MGSRAAATVGSGGATPAACPRRTSRRAFCRETSVAIRPPPYDLEPERDASSFPRLPPPPGDRLEYGLAGGFPEEGSPPPSSTAGVFHWGKRPGGSRVAFPTCAEVANPFP